MNKERRKEIELVIGQIGYAGGWLENLINDEQEYFDNMPEGLQGGEKGDLAQAAIDSLQAAFDNVIEALSSLEEAGA